MLTRTRPIRQNLWDRIWRDKQGRVVIFQMPNAPLIGWVVLTLLSFFTRGTVADVFGYAGELSLAIWAGLEIVKGVNYFRKVLGVLALLYIIANLLKLGMTGGLM